MTQEPPGTALSDLPLLTEVVDTPVAADLPTLTEVVAPLPLSRPLSEEEIQQLLGLLESRLELVFVQRLSQHLEKLQRLAIRQAVNEFRTVLPELLHQMLDAPDTPHDPPP